MSLVKGAATSMIVGFTMLTFARIGQTILDGGNAKAAWFTFLAGIPVSIVASIAAWVYIQKMEREDG
jgi:hypothetical protein